MRNYNDARINKINGNKIYKNYINYNKGEYSGRNRNFEYDCDWCKNNSGVIVLVDMGIDEYMNINIYERRCIC